MNDFVSLVADTWQLSLLLSSILISIYFLIRRKNADFAHVLEICAATQGLVMTPPLCHDAYMRLMCNSDFERAFLIVGFLATGWLAIRTLKQVFSKSQPQ